MVGFEYWMREIDTWYFHLDFRIEFCSTNPTALLIAHIPISDFRYDYCGSIPLATALDINIGVFGAEAVLV